MTQQIKLRVYLLSLLILLFSSFSANAAEYYVATNGNDANSGTETLPWLTLRKAVQMLQAGDTAYIRGGTYTSYSNMSLFNRFEGYSGTAGNPITIKNYPGETPIIDGGFTVASGRVPIFDIDGHSYITIDGLTIRRGSIANIYLAYDSYATNIVIQNSDIKEFAYSDNSANIFVEDADNITIKNNLIHDGQNLPQGLNNGAGIIIFRSGTMNISNNEIYSTNNGIYYKHSNNDGKITTIENNLIYNQTGRGLKYSRADSIIRNNIIRSSSTGIEIFEESASCDRLVSARNQILHNTVIDNSTGITLNRSVLCPGAVDTIVKDNLVYNFTNNEMRGFAVLPYWTGSDTSNTTFDHNLIYSSSFSSPIRVLGNYYTITTIPSTVTVTGNIQQAPIFKDYANRDFTLLSGSPGKNAASDGYDMGADTSLPPTPTPDDGGNTPPPPSGGDTTSFGGDTTSGGSGCGFVRDDGKGQGAKGEGLSFAIMLVITLAGIALLKKGRGYEKRK